MRRFLFCAATACFGTVTSHASPPPPGDYVCKTDAGEEVSDRNFTLVPPSSTYVDAAGMRGTYKFDDKSLVLSFSGGAADGKSALYSVSETSVTLTFANPDGSFDGGLRCRGVG